MWKLVLALLVVFTDCACYAVTTGFQTITLGNSPYAYYRFNETSGTAAADKSGNNLSAIYIGAPTLSATGAGIAGLGGDTAVTLNGISQAISLTNLTVFGSNLGSFGVEFLFKTSTAAQKALLGVANSSTTTTFQILLNTDLTGALSRYTTRIYIRDDSGNYYAATFYNTKVYSGTFVNLLLSFDKSSGLTVYVNGTAQTLTLDSANAITSTSTFSNFTYTPYLGATNNYGTVTSYSAVTIDEAAFYTTTLSASQATAHWKGVIRGLSVAFCDNFSSTTLNTRKWNTAYYYSPTVINDELQFYSPDAVTISSDSAVLTAQATSANGMDYTSGLLTTLDKFYPTYGYFEIRANLPEGAGFWPAFWLLPQGLTWPPEIDVFEMLGHEMNIPKQGFIFTSNSTQSSVRFEPVMTNLGGAYHNYALLWEPGSLVYFIDGAETARIERSEVPAIPMYVLLNMAIGGWAGSPNSHTTFPSQMSIDYVRCYSFNPSGAYSYIPTYTQTISDSVNPAIPGTPRFYIGKTDISSDIVSAGSTFTVSTQIKATATKSSVFVQLKLRRSSDGSIIAKKTFGSQTFIPETFKTFTNSFTIPSDATAGDYTVAVEINNQAASYAYLGGNSGLRPFVVGTNSTLSFKYANIATENVTLGNSPVLTFSVTSTQAASDYHLHVFIYDSSGNSVAYKNIDLTLPANQAQAISWTIPSTLSAGTYTFHAQMFNTAYTTRYDWFSSYNVFSVTE